LFFHFFGKFFGKLYTPRTFPVNTLIFRFVNFTGILFKNVPIYYFPLIFVVHITGNTLNKYFGLQKFSDIIHIFTGTLIKSITVCINCKKFYRNTYFTETLMKIYTKCSGLQMFAVMEFTLNLNFGIFNQYPDM
jgi:hypothetical protein